MSSNMSSSYFVGKLLCRGAVPIKAAFCLRLTVCKLLWLSAFVLPLPSGRRPKWSSGVLLCFLHDLLALVDLCQWSVGVLRTLLLPNASCLGTWWISTWAHS
eukprot:g66289.t1